jgi:phosphoglycerate dehydrogenase-like enzyme
MTTTNTPLVLLWINEAGPYRQELTRAGLDARVEMIHVPLTEEPFWSTEGITVLPHIGGLQPGRDHIVAALFADNLERFLAGRPLRETVDRARGY